jgi:endonuclease/exonuclease/phosphatase (EEP) superfamily protein YafD
MRNGVVALMLVLLGGCVSRPTRTAAPIAADTPHVTVATYNVNYALADDAQTLAAVAQQTDADVVFLQETNERWEQNLRASLGATYPHIEFKHHPPCGGLAVLSKLPIERIEYIEPTSWFPAARVVIDSAVGKLQVLSVHLRPPISDSGSAVSGYFGTPPVRREEVESFTKKLDPSLPTLIVGDFNESESGEALKWLRGRGYTSALPEFAPKSQTWRWKTSYLSLHGRYDHLCYDHRLTPVRVEVRSVGRSDHLPVVGVFTRAGQP